MLAIIALTIARTPSTVKAAPPCRNSGVVAICSSGTGSISTRCLSAATGSSSVPPPPRTSGSVFVAPAFFAGRDRVPHAVPLEELDIRARQVPTRIEHLALLEGEVGAA